MRVITGTARGMTLKAPKGMDTRPTMDQVKEGSSRPSSLRSRDGGHSTCLPAPASSALRRSAAGHARPYLSMMRRDACQVVRENLARHALLSVRRWCRWTIYPTLARGADGSTSCFSTRPTQKFFLENALKRISEIDILTDSGIIICERPVEKALADDFPGLTHWRDYKYGKTAVTIFRKAQRA